MSEALPTMLPVTVPVAADGGAKLPPDDAGSAAPNGGFDQLLHGLVNAPTDTTATALKTKADWPGSGLSGALLTAGSPGGAASGQAADLSAAKALDKADATTEGSTGKQMTELQFLFQRHAGKPINEIRGQANHTVEPALEAVARSDNPRLASILALLLKDGTAPGTGSLQQAPPADLPDVPFFAASPPSLPGKAVRSPGNKATEHSMTQAVTQSAAQAVARATPQTVSAARLDAATGPQHAANPTAAFDPIRPPVASHAYAATVSMAGPDKPLLPASTPTGVGNAASLSSSLVGGILLPQAPAIAHQPAAIAPHGLPVATTQVAEQLVWMAQTGQHSAQVRLHPEELGMVNIRITLEGGAAQIAIDATHPDMIQELTSAAPRLRSLLANEGLGLHSLEIDQRQAGMSGERDKHDGGQANRRQDGFGPLVDNDDADATSGAEMLLARPVSVRLLDLFA